ncbi:JAB domain-containing protein [Sphingorhabdus contaminans]|uniref:JAB domain-containing protein n=1 Tax=Sphingorhabdus contaminans TaxID=1343899 RepID=UPI001476DD24|nr:DNA repair protein RadC [Sphingorhabdus contaminans]
MLTDLLRSSSGGKAEAFSHSLLERYGSLAALLFDIRHQKKLKVELPEAATMRILDLSDLLLNACASEVRQGQILSSSQALRRYLQLDMAGCSRECFRVLYLDAANRLLLDQIMWEGTISCVQAHPREIVRVALLNDATAIILAHNHPSGRMHPSADDRLMTQNIIAACNTLDIKVHDHLIVTRSGVLSMMKR